MSKPYSKEQTKLIMRLHDNDCTPAFIAARLVGRTEGGIARKISRELDQRKSVGLKKETTNALRGELACANIPRRLLLLIILISALGGFLAGWL